MPDEYATPFAPRALAAIQNAQATRASLARKTRRGDFRREGRLRVAARELTRAMRPIRAQLGRTPADAELRQLSQLLQRERRKIFKMQDPAAKPPPVVVPPVDPDACRSRLHNLRPPEMLAGIPYLHICPVCKARTEL